MQMKIRQFETGDLDCVMNLANKYALFDGPTGREDFENSMAFMDGFLVAEVDGAVVGFIQTTLKEVPKHILENWGVEKAANIDLLVVAPSHRGRGYAKRLLENALTNLEQVGVDMIMLHCPAEAGAAKNLYEKMGFTVNAFHMRRKSERSS
jgi:ribosomal protein S18 acetylase RimI-like enzyme